jgi:hypothetical protein
MLKLNDLQNVTVTVVKRNTIFKIASYYHNLPPIKAESQICAVNEHGYIVTYILHQKKEFCNRFFSYFQIFSHFRAKKAIFESANVDLVCRLR